MKAMLLAAGRGERMRPLSDQTPKALLAVKGKPLIVYHLENLARSGITEVVINLAYRGDEIKSFLGSGRQFGMTIQYSVEQEGALETGGGIYHALPLLGNNPFMVVSADIFTDYPFQQLPSNLTGLAHLVMVDNPSYHLQGDFSLVDNLISLQNHPQLTYANIGVYHPDFFQDCLPGVFPLGPLLKRAIVHGLITGEHYQGAWENVGTPEQLLVLNR